MARPIYSDYLNVSRFHLYDISIGNPLYVLTPIFGFKSCSLPQMNVTYKQIKEGNYEYVRYGAVERVEITPILLEQGVTLFNSDFGDWIRKAVIGDVSPRNLLLVHFTNINPDFGGGSGQTFGGFDIPGASLGALGYFEDGARLPGRGWYLKQARPISYKPGTDFDASSGEISLASLEIAMEEFAELNLGI
jgi:hypothetical protein